MFSSKLLLWLVFCAQAWGTAAIIQNVYGTGNFGASVDFLIQPIVGDYVVAACIINSQSSSLPSMAMGDNQGNSYTSSGITSTGFPTLISFAKINASSGTFTVTCFSNQALCCSTTIVAFEYSGLATTSPSDGSSSSAGTGTSQSPGAISTSNANDLIVGVCGGSQNFTGSIAFLAGSGFTSQYQQNVEAPQYPVMIFEDRIVSSTGSYTASSTSSGSIAWRCSSRALKIQSAGGSGSAYRSLLGVGI